MQHVAALMGLLATVGLCTYGLYDLLVRLWRHIAPRDRERSTLNRTANRPDSAEQLRWVMNGSYQAKRVMSLPEYRVFQAVEAEVAVLDKGYRVFAQTSLGEVLTSSDDRAFRAINSKRVDILVIGRDGRAVLAVEFQGSRHYQFYAAARDAIKKEALRNAGVAYLDILDANEVSIRNQVRSVLGRKLAA